MLTLPSFYTVVCWYRSLASTDAAIAVTKVDSALDSPLLAGKFTNLDEANQRIAELEARVNEIEMMLKDLKGTTAKKFPDVTFLNYRNRKRILVSLPKISEKDLP